MRPNIEEQWIIHFQNNGYPEATGIDVGMEGSVYSLIPGELVAKVWYRRSEQELRQLQQFYQKLSDFQGTIQTPELLDIDVVNETLISKERFLRGTSLGKYLEEDEVTDALVTSFGLEHQVILAYRDVYSLITSNAYAVDGSDGHYRWCMTMLQREDVRASLGL